MDSNETSEDKNLEASNEMEVSESVEDKKSENESDKASSENMVTKENDKSENVNDVCAKTNETEKDTVDSQAIDSAKINTVQNDSKTIEAEKKKDNDKPVKVSNTAKNTESSDMDTSSSSIASATLNNTKEGKRKRKSTNTPPARASPVEQNGGGGGSSASKRKRLDTATPTPTPTQPALLTPATTSRSDKFCWRCHKESIEAQCSACPRSWHRRCMGGAPPLSCSVNWICAECAGILQAENAETRSAAMAQLSVDQLCMMLKHVVERMRDQTGSEPFWKAVDLNEVPNYLEYVVKPMDLGLLESNVRAKLYGSTDAFMADARWIQHNCIVFNTCGGVYADTSKLTNTAKQMLKVARQEVSEIEACPDCFAHGRNLPRPLPSWFIEPCRRPHPIVWAKLKGFPFWPAKAMPRLNTQGLVDVRFFGEHDRAWVSPKDIYLYSQEPPVGMPKKKKLEMEQCVKEVEEHSKKLEEVFGEFRYAEPKIQYDPHDPMQIQVLLPDYDPSQNKRVDKSSKAAEVPQNQQQKQESPVNNKVIPPAAEKKPQQQDSKSPPVTPTTNGLVLESPVEKRKLVRKKKAADSPQQLPPPPPPPLPPPPPVHKPIIPEVEAIAVVAAKSATKSKSKSKSPPGTPPVLNNNVNSAIGSVEKPKGRMPESPEITTVLEISANSPPRKSVTTLRKTKIDGIKRIKLTKVDRTDAKRANVIMKSAANGRPATIVHSMPALNSLQNHVDAAKTVSPGQKPKAIYIHPGMRKSTHLVGVNSKFGAKSPSSENNKLASKNFVNKVVGKEVAKFPVINNAQKMNKDETMNNIKPMTAIPVSAKKDQKAMYLMMNSNTSESAKHFSEKDARLSAPVTVIKQEPKDDIQPKLTIARKPSKARKSFPNKPPSFPQVMTPSSTPTTPSSASASSSYPLAKAASSDAMVYIPPPSGDDLRAPYELPPPEAGPATAQIHHNSRELANRVAQLIADTIKDAAESSAVGGGSVVNHHEATIHYLKLRMERMKWEHQQEITELRHNNELVVRELKASMEVERYRSLQDARREAEIDKLRCIEETKRKQWCVVCGREAMFYCCWNTAYCDYPCQQKHWSSHLNSCAQKTQPQSQPQAQAQSQSQQQQQQQQQQHHQQQQQQHEKHQQQRGNSGSSLKAQQQVMPKLVINRSHPSTVLRRA